MFNFKNRKMKKIVLTFLLVFPLLFTACDNDNGPTVYMQLATLQPGVDTKYQFTAGEKTYVPLSTYNFGNYKPDRDNGQRVYIAYHGIENQEERQSTQEMIDLISIQNVLTKDVLVLNESNKNDIADEAIRLIGCSLTDGYLNLEFDFYSSMDATKVATINLVDNQLDQDDTQSQDELIPLEVRLTNPGNNVTLQRALVSFYLGNYNPASITGKNGINLRIRTFYGIKKITLKVASK